MREKLSNWLNKGDRGYSWYEPYFTNRDMLYMVMTSFVIIFGCYLTTL